MLVLIFPCPITHADQKIIETVQKTTTEKKTSAKKKTGKLITLPQPSTFAGIFK